MDLLMTNEAEGVVALAKNWFQAAGPSHMEPSEIGFSKTAHSENWTGGTWAPAGLLQISEEVRELLVADFPQSLRLERTHQLFDLIAGTPWKPDHFGEKHEICSLLCFIAWRHASALGLESEAQEWLRTADLLASENFAAAESLESFLFLDRSQKTPALVLSFLGTAFDLFLAVSILRRERLASPMRVVERAVEIYEWLSGTQLDYLPTVERAFFLGEFAFLAAAIYRPLGRRREQKRWLSIARSHFRSAPANRPLRLKVLALRLIASRDAHQAVARHLASTSERLRAFGMYHEALSCRLGIALVDKIFGRNSEALLSLRAIAEECESSSEQGVLAAALSNIAEIHCLREEQDEADLALAKALAAAEVAADPVVKASVWSCIGAVNVHRRLFSNAVPALLRSLEHLVAVGCSSWLGYARILLAEALVEAGAARDACEQLLLAIPILRRENMIPEGIHALKILGVLAAYDGDGRENIREMICEIQAIPTH